MYVLGDNEVGGGSVLDQSLVPFRSRPVFLRLVNSQARAMDYAAGGFHVSVARGVIGGCADRAEGSFLNFGATCTKPLGRDDIRNAWSLAASLYLQAFGHAKAGVVLTAIKGEL